MAKAKKFGALSGVFTPSILTILGVIMYLRLPWIVGQAGLWATLGIILVAHIISFTTGLSVASIATDKRVETGGSYYIISRSLGLPIGGTLGLALFTGLSFSISLYLIGFSEVLLGITGFEVTINNIRIAGALALLGITILTFISTSLAIKSQYLILTVLALSLLSIFFGNHDQTPSAPLFSSMTDSLPWITLFAIFFPAVTGFEAGVSMSGDLKDPRRNIPAGTIAAVLVGLTVYVGLAVFFSYRVDRELLVNDSGVLLKISWIPQLVVAGILGATLSSALGSILGAPRILQATAIDRITPSTLAKGYGKSNEPRNALLFTFLIALSGILIGELNVIARIVTIFFIITYGFLNITYAVESWAGTDFRPTFRIPGIISIIGAITCIVVMIQLDVVAMMGATVLLVGLFLFLKKRELTLQTGDTWHSVWTSVVKTGLGRLIAGNKLPRNWRPNIILFSGGIKNRPYLIDTAKSLVGELGIFTNFELVENRDEKTLFSKSQQTIEEEAMAGKGVFTRKHVCRDIYEGMESIAKIYGFSGFDPNTVLMGWPRNTRDPEAFARLVRKFRKLDYNQVYLNYDKTFGFGKMAQIDIWWNGKGRNISFALSLIRFITSTHEWRGAKTRIIVVNNNPSLNEKYYELIDQILENKRVKADVKIISNSVEKLSISEIMRSESINTDLAITELDETNDNFFRQINLITESLPTSMVIGASTFFDEHKVVSGVSEKRDSLPETTDTPEFDVVSRVKLADREIVAGEVYKLAVKLEEITKDYYLKCFDAQIKKQHQVLDDLQIIASKTTDQLQHIARTIDPEKARLEYLRVSNDFTYRAQALAKNINTDVLSWQKEKLSRGSQTYFNQLDSLLADLPLVLRIRYNWKEYKKLRAESLGAFLFKAWQLSVSRITSREAIYKVKIARAARYYLYFKRLELSEKIHQEFAINNFEQLTAIRSILSALYEITQKALNSPDSPEKTRNIIQMEKDRLAAAISLQKDHISNFYHKTGDVLESELVSDIQNLNNLLERPGSNFLSRPFNKAIKKNREFLENVTGFSEIWHSGTTFFVNKIYIDFLLLSLKNRIDAKFSKYNTELQQVLAVKLIKPITELQMQIQSEVTTPGSVTRPSTAAFKVISPDTLFNRLFDEITSLFSDLPKTVSIAGEALTRNLEERRFTETEEIVADIRKTVEFAISSELIDQMKRQSVEASVTLAKSVSRIHDLVRLINFNLFDESDSEQKFTQDRTTHVNDFIQALKKEEEFISGISRSFSIQFHKSLKNAFAPLSASVIAKSSGNIRKKFTDSQNRKIYGQFLGVWDELLSRIQKGIVSLIYSRSESILWVGKISKADTEKEISNEEVYSWLDNYTPSKEITDRLPFYYNKLFSGQSGIGDDFWVGMGQEISMGDTAVNRFRQGHPGCILITGERNSGKTSLSKYLTRKHFQPENIYTIRAPVECGADVHLFENTLMKSMHGNNSNLELSLGELPASTAFIINDLEVWWERAENGSAVVERIIRLIKEYRGKVLFIININRPGLRLLNQLTALQSWALAVIPCNGFDAKELHDMIMLRHRAGGMELMINNQPENNLSYWQMASFFNKIFDVSGGNPGAAIQIWLACIKKVEGNTIFLEKPSVEKPDFINKLNREQLYILLQFFYHLRLSVNSLSYATLSNHENIENILLNLWQSGILVEKLPGVYSINSLIQLSLSRKFSDLKLV